MVLPSSGEITLNQIHVEAGGVTGTLCSIDDTDIRALISETAATEHAFSEWYGAGDWIGPDWGVAQYNCWSSSTLAVEGQQYAYVVIKRNGTFDIYGIDTPGSVVNYDWHNAPTGSTVGDDYEFKWQIITTYQAGNGLATTGTTENTWYTLNTTYTIEARDPTFDTVFTTTEDYIIRLSIRVIGTTTPVYTQDFNLYGNWKY